VDGVWEIFATGFRSHEIK